MKSKKTLNAERAVDVTTTTLGGIFRTALKLVVTLILIIVASGLLFTCIFAYYVKNSITTDIDVSLSDFTLALSSTIWYTDENGENHELATLSSKENRIWVDFDEIPEYMWKATIAIEDKRFMEHKGVDWYRTVAAFGNMFVTMKNDFGGSTITQQLWKNISLKDEVTVQRKLLEIFRAIELEKAYTKEEILEWYLNAVYFGEGCWGVYTAANTYFDKNVSELSLAECAAIVGITNQPTKYDPFNSKQNNKDRQETILWEMYRQGMISHEEYKDAVAEELVFTRSETETYEKEIYSYYVETVIADVLRDLQSRKGISLETAQLLLYSGGYQIYCCIDPAIQAEVDRVYENFDNLPKSYRPSSKQFQSAIVVMEQSTGKIIALSGGTGEKTADFELNRATQSQRPPGSAIKPIAVYGPAFEFGLISQNTLVNDAAYPEITLSGTTWYPRNAGGGNRGIVTIRQALTSSLNTVSAQVLDKLTPEASYDFLQSRLGVTSLAPEDRDYAPLALGQLTNGITVREMAQAYAALANNGIFTESRTYTRVTDADGNTIMENGPVTSVAFRENVAWNITDILKNAATYGTGSEANLGSMPVAGKTGTTSDDWDRYFVGYTPYYLAAVWTGYDMPEPMYFRGNPAAQIWKGIMQKAHEGKPYVDFPTPTAESSINIFGDLSEKLAEQEKAKESPEVSEEPDVSGSPDVSESPDVSAGVSDAPITTPDGGDETAEPEQPVEPVETQNPSEGYGRW